MKVKFKMNWAYLKRHWKAIVGTIIGSTGFAYALCREYDAGVRDGSEGMGRLATNASKALAEDPKRFDDEKEASKFAENEWKTFYEETYGCEFDD